jgi:uncharacterized protein (TIGR02118 family)
MASMVVTYKQPKDVAAFEKHYFGVHVPMAKKLPGLRKYEVSRGPVAAPGSANSYYMVATLYFDDMNSIKTAFGSPEGQACADDARSFIEDRVEMLMFDTKEV